MDHSAGPVGRDDDAAAWGYSPPELVSRYQRPPALTVHPARELDFQEEVADTITVVDLSPRSLLDRSRTPGGRKMVRYSLVSVISVIVSQVVLFIAQSFYSARTSNIIAVCVSAVPVSYTHLTLPTICSV